MFLIDAHKVLEKTNKKFNISEDKLKEVESFRKEWDKLTEELEGQGFGKQSSFVASMILCNKKYGVVIFDWKEIKNNDKNVSLGASYIDSYIDSCQDKYSKQLENVQKIGAKMQEGCEFNGDFDSIFESDKLGSREFNCDSCFSSEGAGEGSGKMSVSGEGGANKVVGEGSDEMSVRKGRPGKVVGEGSGEIGASGYGS